MTLALLAFAASGAVVVAAGAALARHADAIAEATGLGRLWIGSVLLAAATSLPELATDVAAVRLGAADLAVGDLFGSSLANMLILAAIDWLPRQRALQRAAFDHALSACLAIALNALAASLVLLRPAAALLSVSPGALLLVVGHLAGTRAIYRHVRERDDAPVGGGEPRVPLRRSGVRLSLGALVLLGAAPVFSASAREIAEQSGLGEVFVGTWLVGLATSLPEVVTCVAAVRIGAFDLAVGNLFGSNAFNMVIFLALDLAQPGSIFAAVDPSHALSGLFGVVLMSLGLAAIVYRAQRRVAMLEPGSVLMLVVYVAAIWTLYRHSLAS